MASDQDTLDAIPALKPDHEDIAHRQGGGGRGTPQRPAPAPRKGGSGGGWLLVTLCLVAVAALGGWSYLLNQQLQDSRRQLAEATGRIEILEQKLSVTDESMSQSSVAMQVKLKELDTEIRKLWDNVWKKAKQELAQHGKDIENLQAQLKQRAAAGEELKQSLAQNQLALGVVEDQLAVTSELSDQLATLEQQLEAQQGSLEEVRKTASSASSTAGKLKKQVSSNEEWVDSFNAYRTQTNRKLLDLQSSVDALQSP